MDEAELIAQNRRSWNAVVPVHAQHRPALAGFLRAGGSTLFAEERAWLEPVLGLRVLHLLCNSGADTLSLAALGAQVTGVDLSDAAITEAQRLAAATGLQAEFVCAEVYAYLAQRPAAQFARIYCGYGTICWLPDLERFAAGIAAALAPGGRFVLMEFHPASNMFDAGWRWTQSYPAGGAQLTLDGVGDYVGSAEGGLSPGGHIEQGEAFVNPHPCHLFRWGLGEVVSALAGAGLRLTALHEYPYVNGERPFARMRRDGQRWFAPADLPTLPLMYGLCAERSV